MVKCGIALAIVLIVIGVLTGLYFLVSYYIRPVIPGFGDCQGRTCVLENMLIVELCVIAILFAIGFIMLVAKLTRKMYRSCAKEWAVAKEGETDSLILNQNV